MEEFDKDQDGYVTVEEYISELNETIIIQRVASKHRIFLAVACLGPWKYLNKFYTECPPLAQLM